MRLDVTHRLVDRVDVEPIRALIEAELAPHFDAPERPLWQTVAARSEWIGVDQRPADVGFRRMRPQGYAQICLINDEQPYSPWALDVPEALDARVHEALRVRVIEPMIGLCRRHYGAGELVFCVLAILGPGGLIPRHRDMMHDPNKKAWSHHVHVPITHAEDTWFRIARRRFAMEVGGVYEIDNTRPHAVINAGSGYRVNVLLDYCPTDNLERRNA